MCIVQTVRILRICFHVNYFCGLGLMYRLNKTCLQVSCNFVVINAPEGSLCFQIFIYVNALTHRLACQIQFINKSNLSNIVIYFRSRQAYKFQ
jgi:hypothetical protein